MPARANIINDTIYKILIGSGCLLWIVFYLADCFTIQPYGIIISMLLTLIGLILWVMHYWQRNNCLPSFKALLKSIFFAGGYFSIDAIYLFAHFREFLVGCTIVGMIIFCYMFFTVRDSQAFDFAMKYVKNNNEIIEKIGTVQGFGLNVGGRVFYNRADLKSFSIIGSERCIRANLILIRSSGNSEWEVEKVELY